MRCDVRRRIEVLGNQLIRPTGGRDDGTPSDAGWRHRACQRRSDGIGRGSHTCALLESGQIKCWGNNWAGQLGDGTSENRYEPVLVTDISDAQWISAGESHTCAVLDDGSVQCWGDNSDGQLGDGTDAGHIAPAAVKDLAGPASAVESGSVHTCALLESGEVQCWGSNYYGRLGSGRDYRTTPVMVIGFGAEDELVLLPSLYK